MLIQLNYKKNIGLYITMCMLQMPSIKSYWSEQKIYYYLLFTKTLTQNRLWNFNVCVSTMKTITVDMNITLKSTFLNISEKCITLYVLMQLMMKMWLIFPGCPRRTGKTFIMSMILATICARSKIVVAMTSSELATTLIDGCRMAHLALQLVLNL